MPYKDVDELPESVQNSLPKYVQGTYLTAYNNASEQYADPEKRRGNASLEEVAHKVAWAAVKKEYKKDSKTGEWKRR